MDDTVNIKERKVSEKMIYEIPDSPPLAYLGNDVVVVFLFCLSHFLISGFTLQICSEISEGNISQLATAMENYKKDYFKKTWRDPEAEFNAPDVEKIITTVAQKHGYTYEEIAHLCE